MCRIPKVLIVSPTERHAELRRTLSSLEYDIVATVVTADEAAAIKADVAIAWEPDAAVLARLRDLSVKVVALGGNGGGADLELGVDDAASFKTRIWELFRPA